MEEKINDIVIKHIAHQHLLILQKTYFAKEGDVCGGCSEQIYSCRSFVYSCCNITCTTKYLLHKTCAELPPKIVNSADKNEFLSFQPQKKLQLRRCTICDLKYDMFGYCSSSSTEISVCLKCAVYQVQQSKEDSIFEHPGHSHPLAVIEKPSSFKCCACKVNVGILDLSYRCTKCQFWMHKSCGDAPHSFRFQFHTHPLVLLFFLPEVYCKFDQFCRICNERMSRIEWLYCCRSCRYFIHFRCARSRPRPMLRCYRGRKLISNLVHLPAADEISLNLLLEQLIKDKVTLSHSYNSISISSATSYIRHWSHEEHDLKLITINELYDRKNNDEILLLCDGCVKPIRTCESLFFACVPCKYFMHKGCAELLREIEHCVLPGTTLFANKYREPFRLFRCYCCRISCNGIFFSDHSNNMLHIGCVSLPKAIQHEAHHHQLKLWRDRKHACNDCGYVYIVCKYGCRDCKFYICGRCIMNKAKTYKHRWDPHPLDLIYDAGMVQEHEHDFDCEFCSKEINTNRWFYHCSKCDLSFHTLCTENSSYREYKNVKFGATDIIIKDELHPHKFQNILMLEMVRIKEGLLYVFESEIYIFSFSLSKAWMNVFDDTHMSACM